MTHVLTPDLAEHDVGHVVTDGALLAGREELDVTGRTRDLDTDVVDVHGRDAVLADREPDRHRLTRIGRRDFVERGDGPAPSGRRRSRDERDGEDGGGHEHPEKSLHARPTPPAPDRFPRPPNPNCLLQTQPRAV